MKYFVGIDVGATRLKAGLVDANHRVQNERVIELTPEDKTADGLVSRLVSVVSEVSGGVRPIAVGFGVAGVVDGRDGSLATMPNFPEIDTLPLKKRLEEHLPYPILVDNDTNCVLTGEYLQGVAAGHANCLGFTLGTGVGGGIIQGGHLWRGDRGSAGELGHLLVDPQGPPCGCGNRGCVEMYASLVGLRHHLKEKPVGGVNPDGTDMPQALTAAAEGGDPIAIEHLHRAGWAFGRGVGTLLNVLNINTIVVAGGLAQLTFPWMEAGVAEGIAQTSYKEVRSDVEFLMGNLGDRAGILGAAMQWTMHPHD